jgi:hypothetical protein
MTLFATSGWWALWYGVTWIATMPFVTMLLWTLLRLTPRRSGEESTWLNGAVLAAFFLLMLTSLTAVMLFVRARGSQAWYMYLAGLAAHFVSWTFLGSAVFLASLQALAAGPRVWGRRLAAVGAVAGVAVIHAATLYATWRFRTR